MLNEDSKSTTIPAYAPAQNTEEKSLKTPEKVASFVAKLVAFDNLSRKADLKVTRLGGKVVIRSHRLTRK